MTLYDIGRPERFLEKVAQCRANVYYLDGAGRRRDLKKLADAVLSAGGTFGLSPIPVINIELEDSADCMRMMNYAMQRQVN